MKRTLLNLLGLFACLAILSSSFAQSPERFTISGYVKEEGSGELLPGVSVYVKGQTIGTQTNKYGFYSISFSKSEELTLVYSFVGYQQVLKTLKPPRRLELNVSLQPQSQVLEEVKVVSDAFEQQKVSETAQMSQISVPIQQIKSIPAFLGEKDVLKVLQLMPGVQKGREGNAGIYVRGGGPDQNLLILDDAPVYNAYHLLGFFSVFNGDALKSVELTKGGFPARFGGRLSSVIEMQMKEGNREKLRGEGGIGILSARVALDGPLTKNKKVSFLFSGRRMYGDLFYRPFIPSNQDGGYYFYDANFKINYDFGQKDKLYLSSYLGKDKGFVEDNTTPETTKGQLYWGNSTATLRWNHLFSERLFANTSLIYSDYFFNTYLAKKTYQYDANNQKSLRKYELDYQSGIRDMGVKVDIDYLPNPEHTLKMGFQVTNHRFVPRSFSTVDIDSAANIFLNKLSIDPIDAVETGLYLEDTYRPLSNLRINAGLRWVTFSSGQASYGGLEPRLSVAWTLPRDYALKASYATMNQFVHLLSNTGVGLPTDRWVPSTASVLPQQSRQIALGMAKDFPEKGITLTFEGYYKTMKNVVNLREGTSSLLDEDGLSSLLEGEKSNDLWQKQITQGTSWSNGYELMIQKKVGRFSGWLGYTLSWTKQQDPNLNGGKEFWAHYDRRHDFSLVGIYKASKRLTLSATWVYGTGNAITLAQSRYQTVGSSLANGVSDGYFSNGNTYDYGERNSFRAAAYHRLDVSVQLHRKMKKGHERTWEWSVYNVYGQKNPFFYDYASREVGNGTTETYLKKYSLFGIIPSFSYSFKF